MLKIDNNGYCDNCYINHNCINCSVMDNLIFYNNSIFDINNKKKIKEHRICECGMPILGNYNLCKDCYLKYKIRGEL